MIAETWYIYDGMTVIEERSNSNIPTVHYTRGLDLSGSLGGAGGISGLLTRSSGYNSSTGAWTTHDHYHADGSGNITMLISNSTTPTIRAQYEYDPFGRIQTQSGTIVTANTQRFSSKEQIGTSPLSYYGFRFYHAEAQRWINRDPIEESGGVNLYVFVGNDAINSIDSFGLYTVKVKKCEVVILYGHGSSTNPHTFKFEGNCSAGHFVGCASSFTNDGIDRKYRIPGAPSTADDLNDGPQAHFDPESAYTTHLKDAWEAAIKKAKAICARKESCCKSVKVMSKLAGNPAHPDNWKQPSGKSQNILCDGK